MLGLGNVGLLVPLQGKTTTITEQQNKQKTNKQTKTKQKHINNNNNNKRISFIVIRAFVSVKIL